MKRRCIYCDDDDDDDDDDDGDDDDDDDEFESWPIRVWRADQFQTWHGILFVWICRGYFGQKGGGL